MAPLQQQRDEESLVLIPKEDAAEATPAVTSSRKKWLTLALAVGAGLGTVAVVGSSSCTNCSSGQYDAATRDWTCNACAGNFKPGIVAITNITKRGACLPCVPGKFQSKFNSTSCKACAEGTFQRLANGTTCEICPEGYYQAESSAPLCFPCSPGKTQSVRGQRSCEKCADGKYQSEAGQTTCDTPDKTRVAVDGGEADGGVETSVCGAVVVVASGAAGVVASGAAGVDSSAACVASISKAVTAAASMARQVAWTPRNAG